IKKETNTIINVNEIKEAIKQRFKENFNFEMIDDSLTDEEIKLTEKLKQEKYSTEEWNFNLIAKTI
ncbi:MAG: hypothetical protein IH852_02230, partial [Bacteroidetes bacterium]|nr:hypothetical protein [Bacteroidota bacterium]